MLPEMEEIYKDIHSHPELSMQEKRTASIAADYLKKYNWEVTTGIGGSKEPEFSTIDYYPVTQNDAEATAKVAAAFDAQFGERSFETPRRSASEDFSVFGREWKVPYVFWFVGGTDKSTFLEAKKNKAINTIPSNHSPKFAPVLHPTLKTGFVTMITAAAAWLNAAK
jgi:metal-dependent amidase/aminoacylase/carboxypeptidase family protein